ncbi:MAG: sodium:solute symporter [Crocinitomicaceae bacterium]|jgi:Na+/proline symporter|nr:sodium:solute symporter [Crocinitomicaceae bacterium]
MTILSWQWTLVVSSCLTFFFLSPWAKSVKEFFVSSEKKQEQPTTLLLTSSLVISWIFAKSISVVAGLGFSYGLVGAVAYGVYYLSFIVAGYVLVRMRMKGNLTSIPSFIEGKFGRSALVLFTILIGFRLFNEVWSNTMIIGGFFGETGSTPYYLAILTFTGLTIAYVIKGGMKSSLFTDGIQMLLFGILLAVILLVLFNTNTEKMDWSKMSGEWKFDQGVNLLLVAFIQIFSYPFHDPVMTDRAFVSSVDVTKKSFFRAGIIGFICIVLFGFVGILAKAMNLEGEPVMAIGQLIGLPMLLLMNFIMITSATSTLDSTFTSFSKLFVFDLKMVGSASVSKGRIAIVVLGLLGTLPVFLNSEVISATTISGTMVLGLAPVFLFWKDRSAPQAYFGSILTGIVFGVLLATNSFPSSWFWTDGKYNDLLWVNIVATIACFFVYFVSAIIWKKKG